MKITQLHALRVRIPQKPPIAPYQSRYRATSRQGSRSSIRLETDTGLVGWGETPDDWINKSFEGTPEDRLRSAGPGPRPVRPGGLVRREHAGQLPGQRRRDGHVGPDRQGDAAAAVPAAGRGGAQEDRAGRLHGHSALRRGQGHRPAVPRAWASRTLKTKAGRDAEEDLEMVRGIRDGVGDRLKLRIDPNMGYAPEVAFPLARDLEKYHLEYFEQPMPQSLHRRVGPAAAADARRRIALNESVTTPEIVAADPAAATPPTCCCRTPTSAAASWASRRWRRCARRPGCRACSTAPTTWA